MRECRKVVAESSEQRRLFRVGLAKWPCVIRGKIVVLKIAAWACPALGLRPCFAYELCQSRPIEFLVALPQFPLAITQGPPGPTTPQN